MASLTLIGSSSALIALIAIIYFFFDDKYQGKVVFINACYLIIINSAITYIIGLRLRLDMDSGERDAVLSGLSLAVTLLIFPIFCRRFARAIIKKKNKRRFIDKYDFNGSFGLPFGYETINTKPAVYKLEHEGYEYKTCVKISNQSFINLFSALYPDALPVDASFDYQYPLPYDNKKVNLFEGVVQEAWDFYKHRIAEAIYYPSAIEGIYQEMAQKIEQVFMQKYSIAISVEYARLIARKTPQLYSSYQSPPAA